MIVLALSRIGKLVCSIESHGEAKGRVTCYAPPVQNFFVGASMAYSRFEHKPPLGHHWHIVDLYMAIARIYLGIDID